jgi:hypothetical protein
VPLELKRLGNSFWWANGGRRGTKLIAAFNLWSLVRILRALNCS